MAEIEQTGVDISFERKVAAEGPGVRQRALAIQALETVSELFGATPTETQVEAIRVLSKQEAKAARLALEATVSLLESARVVEDSQNEHEVIIDKPVGAAPVEAVVVEFAAVEISETVEVADVAVVETEPVLEETTQPQPEAEVAEIIEQDTNVPLSSEITKWLDGLVDRDLAKLTIADIPEIITELNEAHGPHGKRTKIDYNLLLQLRLEGKSYAIIHESLGSSTIPSLKQAVVNFKKRVLTNKANLSATEDEIRDEPVVQNVRPVPRPPVTPTAIRKTETPEQSAPVQAEVVVVADAQEGNEPNRDELRESQLAELMQAAEERNIYSNAEWKEIAEEYIRDVASELLDPEEVDALWQHLHIEDDGAYRLAPAPYKSAIGKLLQNFKEFTRRSKKDTLEQQALRILFNVSMGYNHLGFIYDKLATKDTSITQMRTQRVVVAGIAQVVKGND